MRFTATLVALLIPVLLLAGILAVFATAPARHANVAPTHFCVPVTMPIAGLPCGPTA